MKAVQIIKPGVLKIVDRDKPSVDEKNNVLVRVTACGQCYACKKGRPNVCDNLLVRGVHIDGGYQEFLAVPEKDCYLLPEGLSDVDAVMIEPATIGVQCCSRAQLEPEDMVLIYGYGALGTSLLRIVKLRQPRMIIVADIDDGKLEEALRQGASAVINSGREDVAARCRELTGGHGATVSIDAACVKDSLLTVMNATGNAGRVMTMGFSVSPTEINQFVITSRELDIRGSRLQNRKFQETIDLVREGKVDLRGSVSHTFPMTEAQKAFDLVDSHDPAVRKAALVFGQP